MSVQGQAGKKYGLIIKKRDETVVADKPKVARPGPAVGFEHSSDSELEHSDGDEPRVQISTSKKLAAGDYLQMKVRAETQKDIDKALAEDPTCFQYDEVYDDISHTSTMQRAQAFNKTADRKPKYIEGLLVTAEQRKREYERRVERQIQKERETEGEKFDDKEAFVTSAYRDKLKQMKEDEEKERVKEAEDAKMDVTKQGDLTMFYRNLLDQQTSQPKPSEKEPLPKSETEPPVKEEKSSRQRSRSRSKDRHHRHHRSRSRSTSRSRRDRQKRRSPPPAQKQRSRSRSPKKEEIPEPSIKEVSTIFEKRNVDEKAVLSAKERYLQRKMQRNFPTSDD